MLTNFIRTDKGGGNHLINTMKAFLSAKGSMEVDKGIYSHFAFMNYFQLPVILNKKAFTKDNFIKSFPENINKENINELWIKTINEANETVLSVIKIIKPKYVLFTTINGGKNFLSYLNDYKTNDIIENGFISKYNLDNEHSFESVVCPHPGCAWWYKKSKKFKQSEEHIFYALKDVSLNIKKGSIFGIIGLSGAGKSTLLRFIACLENVDSASIILDGIIILQLKGSQLRNFRKNIFYIP